MKVSWTAYFVGVGLCAVSLVVCTIEPVLSQPYPSKVVRIVVPFPPGGGNDLFGRLVAQKLSEDWKEQVIVENRSGASGMVGSDHVARAAPDGYTLVLASSSSHAIGTHLAAKPLYHPVRDFSPVIHIASAPQLLVVHPSVPARSVKALIALANARPGDLNYGSSGTGSLSHVTGELFKLQANIRMLHVPYRGGPPAVISLVAGHVSVLFSTFPNAYPHVQSGRIRALAVTSAKRTSAAPDVPTLAEAGLAGFEAVQWWGLFAPAGIPSEIQTKLNRDIEKLLGHSDVKKLFATAAAEPIGGSPQEFLAFQEADYKKWGRVVKQSGIGEN